jgi:hypothetical protein
MAWGWMNKITGKMQYRTPPRNSLAQGPVYHQKVWKPPKVSKVPDTIRDPNWKPTPYKLDNRQRRSHMSDEEF